MNDMVEVLSKSTHVAKKDHEDSAGVWVREQLDDIRNTNYKLTFSEWRAIAKLKANKWKIKAGQTYDRYNQKEDGQLYTFKCLPEINRICHKYELYGDC